MLRLCASRATTSATLAPRKVPSTIKERNLDAKRAQLSSVAGAQEVEVNAGPKYNLKFVEVIKFRNLHHQQFEGLHEVDMLDEPCTHEIMDHG